MKTKYKKYLMIYAVVSVLLLLGIKLLESFNIYFIFLQTNPLIMYFMFVFLVFDIMLLLFIFLIGFKSIRPITIMLSILGFFYFLSYAYVGAVIFGDYQSFRLHDLDSKKELIVVEKIPLTTIDIKFYAKTSLFTMKEIGQHTLEYGQLSLDHESYNVKWVEDKVLINSFQQSLKDLELSIK